MSFPALDVAIGVAFMYLLLSLLCTAINEAIATVLQLRGKLLKESISRFLDSQANTKGRLFGTPEVGERTQQLYRHPLFAPLAREKREPSYVAPNVFAAAVLAVFGGKDNLPEHARQQVDALAKHPAIKEEHKAVEIAFQQVEARASGDYKRALQILTVAVAMVLVVGMNADTLHAVRVLWRNPVLREAIVQQAQERIKQPRPEPPRIYVGYLDPQSADPTETASPEEPEQAEDAAENAPVSGLTEAEGDALGQLIGWADDIRAFNAAYCRDLQTKLNTACAGEITPECQRQLDALKNERRCVTVGTTFEPTTAYDGRLPPLRLSGIVAHLPGWFCSIIAMTLGAPFWFDTLSLFMRVRGTGPKPEEEEKKKS